MLRLILILILVWPTLVHSQDNAEFFEQKIRPVLVTKCARCHGAQKSSSGLRVDSREDLVIGGDNGPALVPEKLDESLLLVAIKGEGDLKRMPPDEKLDPSIIADFENWIRSGAVWPDTPATRNAFTAQRHWAYQPVQKIEPPELEKPWSEHPIDRFMEAARREKKLSPVAEANPRTLIRRLSFDLIGLPPTPEEVKRFEAEYVADRKDEVFAREVDRLLESPRYGERWGRHWMDVVRYADTAGDNADYPIPEAIGYRDYIIDSFNKDKPYDLFVKEQIAGDLMPDPDSVETTKDRIRATGYLALSRRYATAPFELWHLTLEDTIDTVGKSFLGMTLKCARCHDHKFDPITKNDYYALYGIFDSTQFPWAGGEEFQSMNRPRVHFVPVLPREQARATLEAHQVGIQKMDSQIAELEKSLASLPDSEKTKVQGEVERLKRERTIDHRRGYPKEVEAAYAVQEGTPHDVPIQISGEPTKPGPVVPRGAIAFLSSKPIAIGSESSGRKELGEWLSSPENPLTARVMVNRIWQHHFGRGIVPTSSNFGLSGSPPSHPELLDYLARYFVEQGWSIKEVHRLILTSKTWRLASENDPEMAFLDTGNEFLWRQNRRRLEAEAIRDAYLSVSGTLDLARPGPHPFPPLEHWNWSQHNQFKERYDSNHRSVYLMTQRLQRHPFLALFDGPDTNTTTDVRTSSIVPTQALYLLNSPEVASIAAAFADRMLKERSTDEERIAWAVEVCFSRPSTDDDLNRGLAYLSTIREKIGTMANAERIAWISYSRVLLISNAFFYVD